MSMVTKCPSCGTAFRVAPQQLQAQHGMVRCGRCATVFDGFKTLAALNENAPSDPPHPTEAANPREDAIVGAPIQASVAEEPTIASDPPPEPAVSAQPPAAVTTEPPGAVMPEPVVQAQSSTAITPEPTVPARPQPFVKSEPAPALAAATFDAGPPPRRNAGWAFGVLLLLTVLTAQGAYYYRGDIAADVPELRPYLNRMCEFLRCTVALPQRPRQISIEASDMQAVDPAHPGLIILTATLRNQATTTLSYPALDVVLTNTKDHTVARRIFLPAEYLDAGKDVRAGIAPSAELTVALNLDSGDLGAAGFRLDLLAAPAR